MSSAFDLPELAARSVGGAVLWANDDTFAERENLIKPTPAQFQPATFGHRGQIYDGWETRRRRDVQPTDNDSVIVRLAAPAVVRGIVVDTSWFTGNYPPTVAIDALSVDGYPPVGDLVQAQWSPLVVRSPVDPDSRNLFEVSSSQRWTHIRLSIFPDGGVARLRVHGEALLDPRDAEGMPLDLASLMTGGRIIDCSNKFYGAPNNLLFPGPARSMGEGWETARRRDRENDWVHIQLGAQADLSAIELDTSYFVGNCPGAARVMGFDHQNASGEWFEILGRTALQPDTCHRFRLDVSRPVTDIRMDIYPDGGMARLRAFGRLTDSGLQLVQERWHSST